MAAIRKAWLSLLGLPLAFLGSFVVGGFLFSSILRLEEGTMLPLEYLPLLLGMLAVLWGAPTLAAFVFGRRAKGDRARLPYLPAWIAATFSIGFIALNLVSYSFSF